MPRAILLLSGGLDSILAGKLLLEIGIEVEAVNYVLPFSISTKKDDAEGSLAEKAAEELDIPFKAISLGADFLEIVKHPRFGWGKGVNPCVDCKIFMLIRAKAYMMKCGADFIVTGEVLGQRPMSQHKQAIELIERKSGLSGMIIRPLSAKLLSPSEPEKNGLVDRERLLDISGRCRRPQMKLAERLGVKEYPSPAGGCILTDPQFAARMKDLMAYTPDFKVAEAKLLGVGRHFRLPGESKAVVGRNESENDAMEVLIRDGDAVLTPIAVPGPTVLCRGRDVSADLQRAAALLAVYTKKISAVDVRVRWGRNEEGPTLKDVHPMEREDVEQYMVSAKQSGEKSSRRRRRK